MRTRSFARGTGSDRIDRPVTEDAGGSGSRKDSNRDQRSRPIVPRARHPRVPRANSRKGDREADFRAGSLAKRVRARARAWHRYAKCSLRLSPRPRRFRGFLTRAAAQKRGSEGSDLAVEASSLFPRASRGKLLHMSDVSANFLGSSRKRILGSSLTRAFYFDPPPPPREFTLAERRASFDTPRVQLARF